MNLVRTRISILVIMFQKIPLFKLFPYLHLSVSFILKRCFGKFLYKAVWKCLLVVIIITCALLGYTNNERELFHQGLQLSVYGVIVICIILNSLAETYPWVCHFCGLSYICWRLTVLEKPAVLLKCHFALRMMSWWGLWQWEKIYSSQQLFGFQQLWQIVKKTSG